MSRALTQLGKRMRALRLERKLTQEQAAEAAKIDGKHWQDIEGARTNPTVATLVGVARALKASLRDLFEPTNGAGAQAGPADESPRPKRGAGSRRKE